MVMAECDCDRRFEETTRRAGRMRPGRRGEGEDAFFAKMWTVLRRFPEAAAAMTEEMENLEGKGDDLE